MPRGGKVRTNVKRDDKGRILPSGISQRKDGRYIWRFTYEGVSYTPLYSWDLAELKNIMIIKKAEILQGTYQAPDKITLNQYYKHYLETYKKGKINDTSYKNMVNYWEWYVADTLGKRKIQKVKRGHIVELYNRLQTREDRPISWGTVKTVNSLIFNTLEKAYTEEVIHKNSAYKVLEDATKSTIEKEKIPLTEHQISVFMNFISNHRYFSFHKNFFTVLFGTGMRVGECCALCKNDILLNEEYIKLYKTLYYKTLEEGGKRQKWIGGTKTVMGTRTIPMLNGVKKAIDNQMKFLQSARYMSAETVTSIIDIKDVVQLEKGYSDFLFLNQEKTPYTPDYVTQIIKKIVRSYNKTEEKKAKEDKRQAVLLPDFSAHCTRHTFATLANDKHIGMEHIAKWLGHSVMTEDDKRKFKTTERYVHKTWMTNYKGLKEDVQTLNEIKIE